MYELKNNGKVFTSKFVWTGPSSYEKRIYRVAVSRRLRNTALNLTSSHPFEIRFHTNYFCGIASYFPQHEKYHFNVERKWMTDQ